MSDVRRFATRGSTRTEQGRPPAQPGQNGGPAGPGGNGGPGPQGRTRPPGQPGYGNGNGSTQTLRGQAPVPAGMQGTGQGPSRPTAPRSRAPRRAHLLLSRLDPWSVMKFSFVVSLVLFVVLFVAVAVLYSVLAGMGVFDAVVSTAHDLSGGNGWDVSSWFSAKTILGWTAVLGAVNVVLITALATLGAFIYNLVTSLVGGVEVTLSEAE